MKEAIGVLDSGVGGLTVIREAMRQLPTESLIYIGDNARCPYGPRPKEEVIQYTCELAHFLVKKNIKMLVIACNTATALTLDILREELDIPVLGVIQPGAFAANKYTKNEKIGIIATETTVNSGDYQRLLHMSNPDLELTALACPNFVSLVESHEYQTPLAKKIVAQQLAPFKKAKVDTMVLGCTHFPILAPVIQRVMGKEVTLVDSGKETIADVASILEYEHLTQTDESFKPIHQFYTTGSPELFKEIADEWLDAPITVQYVDWREL